MPLAVRPRAPCLLIRVPTCDHLKCTAQGNIFFLPNATAWLAPPALASRMIAEASQGLPQVLRVAQQPAVAGLDVLACRNVEGTEL